MESEVAATVQATTPRGEAGTPATAIEPKKRGRKPKNNYESQSLFSQQHKSTEKKKKNKKTTAEEKYSQWKTLVPVLYDSLANYNLVWPSLSCRSVFFFSSVFYSRVFCLCSESLVGRLNHISG